MYSPSQECDLELMSLKTTLHASPRLQPDATTFSVVLANCSSALKPAYHKRHQHVCWPGERNRDTHPKEVKVCYAELNGSAVPRRDGDREVFIRAPRALHHRGGVRTAVEDITQDVGNIWTRGRGRAGEDADHDGDVFGTGECHLGGRQSGEHV